MAAAKNAGCSSPTLLQITGAATPVVKSSEASAKKSDARKSSEMENSAEPTLLGFCSVRRAATSAEETIISWLLSQFSFSLRDVEVELTEEELLEDLYYGRD